MNPLRTFESEAEDLLLMRGFDHAGGVGAIEKTPP
jgi:hypothetical protein